MSGNASGITQMDVRRMLRTLQDAGYNIPRDTDDKRLARVWCRYMSGFDVEAVNAAVDGYIRDGKHYWPKPGEILQRAREGGAKGPGETDDSPRGRYLRWEQTHDGPCPVCGATIGLHGSPPRYHYRHNADEHHRQDIPHIGLPLSREDQKMYDAVPSWEERKEAARQRRARKRKAAESMARQEPTESERRAKEAARQFLEPDGEIPRTCA